MANSSLHKNGSAQAAAPPVARPLATALASRDSSETIVSCASYLAGLARYGNGEGPGRLNGAFPRLVIVKEGGMGEHRQALEQALSLVVRSKDVVTQRMQLAAMMMLADVQGDGRHVHAIAILHEETTDRAHSRVKLVHRLAIANGSADGLGKILDGLYILKGAGIDLPIVQDSLRLLASSDCAHASDLDVLAARAMLSGI